MPIRLALGSVVVFVACGNSSVEPMYDAPDGILDSPLSQPPDGFPADAEPDAWEPDTMPPFLASITPVTGTAVWLHAPIRLTFDEPIEATSIAMTVTATLAGSAVPAQLAFEAPSTLIVTLAANVRGVGALDVGITGTLTDLAGNVYSSPIALSFVAPAWSSIAIDRGYAASAPELAVAANGTLYAAWLVGNAGARRVVVSALVANTWESLGGALGASDAGSVAIAIDGNGEPLVAWSEAAQAHVARWTGAWTELTSPGSANTVALVVPPNGEPLVGLFGATAGVRELAGTAWQALGMDITLPSSIANTPCLAAGAARKPVIGWVDAQSQLRVYRYDTSWTAITPIAVSAGSRMSLAARGTALAIAWDQYAGSYGVLAAQLSGVATTWTRLGRALDVDISGNAVAPAVAFDASGAPVVTWTELVETNQRGALARWTGSAWSVVGGVSWLDNAVSSPMRSLIALHANEAAVVATSAAGTVRIARFNGPRIAAAGMTARASIAGCSFAAANPPALLSQTGCFNLATPNRPVPHAGLVPYDVVSELWSDGAKKRRYIGLPDNTGMTVSSNGSWSAPVGTIMIKQFDLETTPGNPATRRPIETRFFVNDATLGWSGFSYKWNVAGTDAQLLTDGVWTFDWQMDDGTQHEHQYPSRSQCRSCHHSSMGPLLGVRSEQLARWNDYNGVIADQLQTLNALGIAPVASAMPFVSAQQPGETWERRMRGYMAGNCAHCHNPSNLSVKDLRYTTPLAQTNLCSSISPGNPSGSQVYQLVTSRPGMPCLGTLAVDPLASQTLAAWISGMTSCP
ncbi:MAG TPA: Ig-like domain-containing protein [Kofleriaceae bacterium]|nr:Ig-like domain-containing protein [Kofleriaceae bacterium]